MAGLEHHQILWIGKMERTKIVVLSRRLDLLQERPSFPKTPLASPSHLVASFQGVAACRAAGRHSQRLDTVGGTARRHPEEE